MRIRHLLILCVVICGAILSGILALHIPTAIGAVSRRNESGLEQLTIVTRSGPHRFMVEVERTRAQLERGLMFRRYLPKNRGMLFDFKTTQSVMMWMKNTYIPLDMIFISKNGRVANIAANAQPLSETIIPSGAPVFAVLEVNGGVAKRIGLAIGDQVKNALFSHSDN